MTVKELIMWLNDLPHQDARVLVYSEHEAEKVDIDAIVANPEAVTLICD